MNIRVFKYTRFRDLLQHDALPVTIVTNLKTQTAVLEAKRKH